MMAISAIFDPSWLAKSIGKRQVGPMEKYGKDGRNAWKINYLQKRSVLHKRSWRKIWVKLAGAVYVLHAFQKKSKKGIKTPQHELELVRKRLKIAEELHAEWRATQERKDAEKDGDR